MCWGEGVDWAGGSLGFCGSGRETWEVRLEGVGVVFLGKDVDRRTGGMSG